MPLDAFIAETMAALATEREEALVPLRNNAGPDEHKLVNEFNAHIAEHPILGGPILGGPIPVGA